MLFPLTSVTDYLGFCISLWLSLYLLARGFPSRITLRTVIILLALAGFFLSASINLHMRVPGATTIRAILLVVALSAWHDLTNRLLPKEAWKNTRWIVRTFYIGGIIIVSLLFLNRNAFIGEMENVLYVGRMNVGPIFAAYGVFQVAVGIAIFNCFRLGAKYGVGSQNRIFFIASLLAVSTVGYGLFALAIAPPLPRLIQDALILSSVILMGVAVARYQVFIERRTTIEDFPVSFLAVFLISVLFGLIAWFWTKSPVVVNLVTALAILTHAIYDLVREFLDRLRIRNESQFHRELRELKNHGQADASIQERLSTGLTLLCKVINASGGFIALKEDGRFLVSTSSRSLPIGSEIPLPEVTNEISQPTGNLRNEIEWLAPALDGQTPVAVIGIGPSKSKNEYSLEDIDLLAEVTDRVASILHSQTHDATHPTLDDTRGAPTLDSASDQLLSALISMPDPDFVKVVEDGLRSMADIVKLGESPLVKLLNIQDGTQLERGRAIRDQLLRAIEMLKPEGTRPPEPLPRDWYNYVVLYDAYVKDVPNREIMARMYVSEGTFNRTRRNALRGLARHLHEQSKGK